MSQYLITESIVNAEKVRRSSVRREQRERWDAVAQAMPDLLPAFSTQYYRRREIALIQRHFGSLKGRRVLKLDLWNEAFNTRILEWMQSQGAEVFGLDLSHIIASRAHRNCRGHGLFDLTQADIRRLPFKSNSFDYVYTMGTIEHIEEYEEALAEVQRVLKVGGRAIVGVPHKWDIFLRPLLVAGLELLDQYPYSPEKSFSFGELRYLVEKAGLRARARTGVLAFPAIFRLMELFLLRRKVSLYEITAFFLWPFEYLESRWEWVRVFGYLVVVVAEKMP